VCVCVCDFRAKSRGSKTPASAGRDRKGEKESEKDKGRTPADSRRAAGTGDVSLISVITVAFRFSAAITRWTRST